MSGICLTEFVNELNLFFRASEFSDCCPNGLQIEGRGRVHKVGFAVSASLATLQEAKERGVDALIVHHGLFWNKDPYPLIGMKKHRVAALIAADISLIAYHLPLDAHPQVGNNWKAALDLGWQDLEPFAEYGKHHIGVKGTFAPLSVAAFQQKVESYYGHVAHTALADKPLVTSAALISGGAHRQLEDAAREGVDCFITGSFDEMNWEMAKELGVHFFALGHHATERIGILALMQVVQTRWKIPCEWIESFNPF
jgi:dinuclear metal center YbgI/SA1388 family protein